MIINQWIDSKSVNATIGLGLTVGRKIKKGSVIVLEGEIGTGKTTFTKGLAKGLGLKTDISEVLSPTFVFIKEYPCRVPLYHVDLYRLKRLEGNDEALFDECLDGKGVTVVEWGLSTKGVNLKNFLLVEFEHVEDKIRRLRFRSKGNVKWP
jgi:tRNA threonylcarbamoyladenosine biosynthesis protein TsaE